jgi:hypothetical protein
VSFAGADRHAERRASILCNVLVVTVTGMNTETQVPFEVSTIFTVRNRIERSSQMLQLAR